MNIGSIACFVCRLPGGARLLRVVMKGCLWDAGADRIAHVKRAIELRLRNARGMSRVSAKTLVASLVASKTNAKGNKHESRTSY